MKMAIFALLAVFALLSRFGLVNTPSSPHFITTLRIHENMPEFTFSLYIGDLSPEPSWYFPNPREIWIKIKDENENVFQELTGLTANDGFNREDLVFDDFNFDGYFDFRLIRWYERFSRDYFWFWSEEKSRFELNEQLAEITTQGDLFLNPKTQRIGAFTKIGASADGHLSIYEFRDEKFVLVKTEEIKNGDISRFLYECG